METKELLDSRSREELVDFATRLAAADSDLRWALIQARKRAGFTQADLAEVLGISQPAVAQIESMGNDPRLSTLRRYALAVGAMISHQVTEFNGQGFCTDQWTPVDAKGTALTFIAPIAMRSSVAAQWKELGRGPSQLRWGIVA